MPMFLAGREDHDVAGANLLDRAALALGAAATRGDDKDLAKRVRVPGGARAGLEGDGVAGRAGGAATGNSGSMRTIPVKYSAWPSGRRARTRSLDVHASS